MCQCGIIHGKCCGNNGLGMVQGNAKGGAEPLRHPLSPAFFHLAKV